VGYLDAAPSQGTFFVGNHLIDRQPTNAAITRSATSASNWASGKANISTTICRGYAGGIAREISCSTGLNAPIRKAYEPIKKNSEVIKKNSGPMKHS
jgi:hypothetical protein